MVGDPIDPWNFCHAVGDLIRRNGVTPITLHGLRDTHASLCAKAGVPLEVVRQRLGHASIESRPSVICTCIQSETPTRRTPSGGLSARNEKDSAVAHLLHGVRKRRGNPCKIRTILVAPAGFEPMLRGPGTNRYVPQKLILSGFSRVQSGLSPFGFYRIPVRPLDLC